MGGCKKTKCHNSCSPCYPPFGCGPCPYPQPQPQPIYAPTGPAGSTGPTGATGLAGPSFEVLGYGANISAGTTLTPNGPPVTLIYDNTAATFFPYDEGPSSYDTLTGVYTVPVDADGNTDSLYLIATNFIGTRSIASGPYRIRLDVVVNGNSLIQFDANGTTDFNNLTHDISRAASRILPLTAGDTVSVVANSMDVGGVDPITVSTESYLNIYRLTPLV